MSVEQNICMQQDAAQEGRLQITVNTLEDYFPVENAQIQISYTGVPGEVLEQVTTDLSGRTAVLSLNAPLLEYSMTPLSEEQPYAEYTVRVSAEGYETEEITGIEILPGELALQSVRLRKKILSPDPIQRIVIGPHTLFGVYPPKIEEAEIKPIRESGEIVLSRVVVPEYIVVHDGPPEDSSARNYYVKYKDYIKNVASCEIYATWPEDTIRANVLAIMSFTMNRVYTEW